MTTLLQQRMATRESHRDLQREYAELLRAPDFAGLEARLRADLEDHACALADVVLATPASAVQMTGWQRLWADLVKLEREGLEITAIGINLSNYADCGIDAWHDREPGLEYSAYNDKTFPFSTSSRADIQAVNPVYGPPWLGCMSGREDGGVLEITGLRRLNSALLLHDNDHPWQPGSTDVPVETIALELGWWWQNLLFHRTVVRALDELGLPRPMPVMMGTHDVGPWVESVHLVTRVADHEESSTRILDERDARNLAAYEDYTEEQIAHLREQRNNVRGWALWKNKDKRATYEGFVKASVDLAMVSAGLPTLTKPIWRMRHREFEQFLADYRAARERR